MITEDWSNPSSEATDVFVAASEEISWVLRFKQRLLSEVVTNAVTNCLNRPTRLARAGDSLHISKYDSCGTCAASLFPMGHYTVSSRLAPVISFPRVVKLCILGCLFWESQIGTQM